MAIMIPLLIMYSINTCHTQKTAEIPAGCGVYYKNFSIAPEWEKLFSAGRNLTMLYKNPKSGFGLGHEIVRTAMIYLDQIEELEKAVDGNRPNAMDAVWELYICGGPLHTKQIPYDQFIKLFNWDSTDIDEYCTLIDDTKRVWNRLVEELARLADSDIVI